MSRKEDALNIVNRAVSAGGGEVVSLDGRFVPGLVFGKPGHVNFRMRSFVAYGVMRVTDEQKALDLMRDGIGHGKRFGFGMLDIKGIEE